MWVPCLPAMLAGALLVGWALQEPDASDEAIGPLGLAVMAPFALLWLRAAGRALRAWRSGARSGAASTSGLLRPRVSVDPAFAAKLDPEALAAVLAHERAHARHRDPLRIWLAQIATDLQGPWPAARARLAEWREALELARDDEARARGAEGAALAAGILAAVAEFSAASCESGAAVARIEGDPATSDHSERAEEPAPGESADRALRARIERLLTVDAPAPAPQRRLFGIGLVALLLFALAGAVGFFYGDAIVRALPGVIT